VFGKLIEKEVVALELPEGMVIVFDDFKGDTPFLIV
jgi:hypothetical protein